MTDATERRAHERHELLAQVHVRHDDVDHVMSVVNVSRGGALVDLGDAPRPRWLELRRAIALRLFGREGEALVEARGRIVRIIETLESRSFGVQFDEVLDDATLRTALRAAGQPPPLPGA
jgi:hypothetical protein